MSRGDLPINSIVGTNLFSMEKAANSAGWLQTMRDEEVVPETEVYGIDSFVYKARTPFHPKRLMSFLMGHFMVKVESFSDGESESESESESEGGAGGSKMKASATESSDDDDDEEADESVLRERESNRRQKRMRKAFGNILRSKG